MECAGKGEVLPVCFTEGGIHSDLALFLRSDVYPIGGGGDNGASRIYQQDGRKGPNAAGSGGDAVMDGFVTVGADPQSATTIVLKPGFRLILFESSFSSASFSNPPSSCSSLLLLRDLPEALARIQLIRFGGVDCVGVTASDDGVSCLLSADCEMDPSHRKVRHGSLDCAEDGEESSSSSSDEASGSSESIEAQDSTLPPYVLAGMGLISQPGFEMARTMGARLQEELARAIPSRSGKADVSEQQQSREEPVTPVVIAQREALAYNSQLNATHEAVIALLVARPPSFNAVGAPCTPDAAIPPGGEPTTGVSDDVERDQNRVLNNLIETLFAYKGVLEKGVDTVPKCDRASQAKHAMAALEAEEVTHSLASSALRFLARSGDMLHAWGIDPALYSPVFPGVRALVQGAVCRAADTIRSQRQDVQQALESAVVVSLTRSLVTRMADDCKWVLPLAALALSSPGDLPAGGWWDTCVALVGDRRGKIGESGGSASHLKLAKLFKMVVSADIGAGEGRAKDKSKQERSAGDGQENLEACTEKTMENGAVNPGLAQVRHVVGSWLDFYETEVPKLTELLTTGHDSAKDDSEDDGDTDIVRQGAELSPQQWDLGFDTSGWARDRGAMAVAALARDRGIPVGIKTGVEDANGRDENGDKNGNNAFFSTLTRLWSKATTDRAAMSEVQAVEAKAFSRDDVLRRLVLIETTMGSTFARLPGYVMCEAGRWAEWMAEVRRALSAVEVGGGDGSTIDRLRFLLSHPPPEFESKHHARNKVSLSPSSSSSSSAEDSDSSNGSGSGNSGGESGEDSGTEEPAKGSSAASSSATGAGPQPLAVAGEVKPLEALGAHPKVRRDSRERMKIKLGLLDGLGMAAGAESKNDMSAEMREECNTRARHLFGISTSQTRGISLAKNTKEPARFGPAGKVVNTTVATPGFPASVNIHEEDDTGEGEERKFFTFVAESFRPRRDNSDWHREAIPDPVPPVIPSGTTGDASLAVTDQGPIEPRVKGAAAVNDEPAVENETAADTGRTVDTGKQDMEQPTGPPQNLLNGTHSDSDSSSEALPEKVAAKTAQAGKELFPLAEKAAVKDGSRYVRAAF